MTPSPSRSVPIAGVRKMIARKMMESLATTAQLSFSARIDASHLIATRRAWRAAEVEVGYEDLLLVGIRDTLLDHPRFNATATADTLHIYDEICISVAMSIGDILVAPALLDLRYLTLQEIVAARRALAKRAKERKLTVPEMSFGIRR
jgi:pyruvate dehydrogenase E2 component (dihydrolipoamide acetyltransferase)